MRKFCLGAEVSVAQFATDVEVALLGAGWWLDVGNCALAKEVEFVFFCAKELRRYKNNGHSQLRGLTVCHIKALERYNV